MKKIFLKVIPIAIALNLVMGNIAIIGENIVRAVEEKTSKVQIEDTNIEMNVYTEKEKFLLGKEEYLYIELLIKNTGLLLDGKIIISNANYIIDTNYQDKYINKIEYIDGNAQISLNQIRYNEDVKFKIPVKFQPKEEVTTEYMNAESNINLSGKYKEKLDISDVNEINQNIKKVISWFSDAKLETSSKFNKFLQLENKKILIEQEIKSNVNGYVVPKEKESLVVALPNNKDYEKIVVLVNGTVSKYEIVEGKIHINNEFEKIVNWKNNKDVYKIIYTYPEMELTATEMLNEVNISTKLLTVDEQIVNNINEKVKTQPQGNTIDVQIDSKEMYKGHMYSNLENTEFNEELKLNISSVENNQALEITNKLSQLGLNEGTKVDISKNVIMKEIRINKEEIFNILGNDGFINISDGVSKNTIANITSQTQSKEGYIIVAIPENSINIIIKTSVPEKEGCINLGIKKEIGKDLTANVNANTVEKAKQLYETVVLNNIENVLKVIDFLEPTTKMDLNINRNSLTTLEKNKNVEFKLDLIANSSKDKVFVDPTFELILPKEIKQISLNSINMLYNKELSGEAFKIESKKVVDNADGTKSIVIILKGKQEEINQNNTQIVINADIEFGINRVSSTENITLKCKNQNEDIQIVKQIDVKSKYGVMMYTDIKEEVSYIDNEQLDKIEVLADDKEKTFNVQREILNNYDKDITKLEISMSDNVKNIKVNNKEVASNNGVLELEDKTILKNSKKILTYDYMIPENVGFSKLLSDQIKVSFEYDTQEMEHNYKTQYQSETNMGKIKEEEIKTAQTKSFGNVGVIASVAGNILEDDAEITKGQSVKYTGKITNSTDEILTGVKVNVKVNNGHMFGNIEREVEDIYCDAQGNPISHKESYYKEFPNVNTLDIAVGEIKKGETITFEYQIAAEENAEDLNTEVTITGQDVEEHKVVTNKIKCIDSQYLIRMMPTTSIENTIHDGRVFPINLIVKNMKQEAKDSVIVKLELPRGIELLELDDLKLKNVKIKEDGTIEILNLNAGEQREYRLLMNTKTDDMEQVEEVSMLALIQTDNYTYYSNEMTKGIKFEKYKLDVNLKSNIPTTQKLINGDKITLTANLKNLGSATTGVIRMYLPNVAKITKASYNLTGTGDVKNIKIQDNNSVYMDNVTMQNKDEIQVTVQVEIDELKATEETFKASITHVSTVGETTSNVLTYTLKKIEENNNNNSGNNNNGNDNDNPNNGQEPNPEDTDKDTDKDIVVVPEEKMKYISGKAWLDKNKNGIYDEADNILKDIKVNLINKDGDVFESTITDIQGKYVFENIKNGEYLVSFEYDINQYAPTIYNKDGANSGINSDIIGTGFGGKTIAITDIIHVNGSNVEDIDAGLIANPVFDMSLDKVVKKITVKDKNGVIVKEYNGDKLTKIELSARNFAGSIVLIEYEIIVKNEGEVDGYVNEILDYMPKDTTFSSEINSNWYYTNDGVLHNTSLAKNKIAMGEERRVKLVLMKTLNENNIGTTVNIAEIGNATNDLGIKDVNSNYANRNSNENDLGIAENIVSIQTGKEITLNIVAVIVILSTIGTVIFIVKRKEG